MRESSTCLEERPQLAHIGWDSGQGRRVKRAAGALRVRLQREQGCWNDRAPGKVRLRAGGGTRGRAAEADGLNRLCVR